MVFFSRLPMSSPSEKPYVVSCFPMFSSPRLCHPGLMCIIGAETTYEVASNLGILLMNSNCFAIYSQQHSSYVSSDIYFH